MSFAYMPLYTGDYLRDTSDLSPREHGAYLLMLMWCWQRAKPMPNDMLRICRIAKARDEQDEIAVRHVLSEFFVLGGDGCYHNERIESELKRSSSYVERAKAGAAARWSKHPPLPPEDANGHAKPVLNGCLADAKSIPPSPSPYPKKEKAEARATRFALSALPDDWLSYCKERRPDLNPQEVFENFCDHWMAEPGKDGLKLNWRRTWQKWVRSERATPDWAKPKQTPEQIAAEAIAMLRDRDQHATQ